MKEWYENRMETGVNHRGFNVPKDKYLYLTEAQAKIHNNKGEERVAKVNTPPKKEQVAVLADWSEWEKAKNTTTSARPKATDNKGKSFTKANHE